MRLLKLYVSSLIPKQSICVRLNPQSVVWAYLYCTNMSQHITCLVGLTDKAKPGFTLWPQLCAFSVQLCFMHCFACMHRNAVKHRPSENALLEAYHHLLSNSDISQSFTWCNDITAVLCVHLYIQPMWGQKVKQDFLALPLSTMWPIWPKKGARLFRSKVRGQTSWLHHLGQNLYHPHPHPTHTQNI